MRYGAASLIPWGVGVGDKENVGEYSTCEEDLKGDILGKVGIYLEIVANILLTTQVFSPCFFRVTRLSARRISGNPDFRPGFTLTNSGYFLTRAFTAAC